MSKKIDCPFVLCNTSDSVERVLAHIRSVHDSSHLPQDFIDFLHLQRCKFCHNWFFKLTIHQSRCLKRCIKSDEIEKEYHVTQRSADVADATINLGSSGFGPRGNDSSKDNCCRRFLESNERGVYTEKEAWSFIRDFSVINILCHHPPNTVRVVSQKLKPLFQDCCDIAFKRILNDPSDESGLKLLFLLPIMVLRHTRGGSSAVGQARSAFQTFLQFRWNQLLFGKKLTAGPLRSSLNAEVRQRAALILIKRGELSRAAKLLVSPELAPATAEDAERLAAKHPPREKNVPTSCEAFQSLSLSRLEFLKTLRNTPKGSGCGPSGWKYEHMKALVNRSTTAEGLFSVCDLIAQGKIPPAIHEVISSSRLIASPKENGAVRPIAIGECLRRFTAKVICIQKKESFNSHFQPIQHGVAVKRGTELLIHHVSLLLELNPDWVLLKTDIKNAFNSLELASLMPQVAKSFPDV